MKINSVRLKLIFGALIVVISPVFISAQVSAASYIFPVIGKSTYSNDYLAPRSDGPHHAIDIIANKRQKIVAAIGGVITYAPYPQPSWGFMVRIVNSSGYTYDYIHLNNDTPGTDDGKGGGQRAYAPWVKPGNKVRRGQLLGWVGDSGNAENTVSHLHFEVRDPDGKPFNPYKQLKSAQRITRPTTPAVQNNEIAPFGQSKRNTNIATGDFTGDSKPDYVASNSTTLVPVFRIFDSSKKRLATEWLDTSDMKTPIDVAVGNVVGDAKSEVIASARTPSGAKVWVYQYDAGTKTLTELSSFIARPSVKSVMRVTTADVNLDGYDEIVVASGKGDGAYVYVFDSAGNPLGNFNVFNPATYNDGLDVAGGDVTGDGRDEIVTGRLQGGYSIVRVFDGQSFARLSSFRSYAKTNTEGVRVAVGSTSLSAKQAIVTAPRGGSPTIKSYTYDGSLLKKEYPIEQWWNGWYDVSASYNATPIGTGINRRAGIFIQ